MSIQGKWRIVEMPDYDADFPNTVGLAYILFVKLGDRWAYPLQSAPSAFGLTCLACPSIFAAVL